MFKEHRSFLFQCFCFAFYIDGGMPPRSSVVIHSATNVIQDSLVYLNQPEKEESSIESKEGLYDTCNLFYLNQFFKSEKIQLSY